MVKINTAIKRPNARPVISFSYSYFFTFIIPHVPNAISTTSPIKKTAEGNPSKIILTILPAARPNINKTFSIVAAFHHCGLIIPVNQNTAMAIYKPIIALKIPAAFIVSMLN
jgi:hypothetical protein